MRDKTRVTFTITLIYSGSNTRTSCAMYAAYDIMPATRWAFCLIIPFMIAIGSAFIKSITVSSTLKRYKFL